MVFSSEGVGPDSQASPQATGEGGLLRVKSAALLAVLAWVALRDTDAVLLGAGVGPLPA
jgi:hypothetical protein